MSHQPRSSWPLRLALTCYRLAMTLYPAAFRKHYGDELVQVFRAALTANYRNAGLRGVMRVTLLSCWDVMITALVERKEYGVRMTRKSWVTLGAFAFFAASVLAISDNFVQTISLLISIHTGAGFLRINTWYQIWIWSSLPSSLIPLLLAVGAVAYYLQLHHTPQGRTQTGLARIGVGLAITGAIIASIGGVLLNVVTHFANQCYVVNDCIVTTPINLLETFEDLNAGGFLIFLLGIVLLCVAGRWVQRLLRLNGLLITLAILPIFERVVVGLLLNFVINTLISSIEIYFLGNLFASTLWWAGVFIAGLRLRAAQGVVDGQDATGIENAS